MERYRKQRGAEGKGRGNVVETERGQEGMHSMLMPAGAYAGAVLTAAEQERLLVEHLPIVRFLARRIHERLPQHVDLEDLVSAGVVGLMDAFTKFDPAKKVQFRSYAQFRIRGAILDSLRTLDWSPRDLRRKDPLYVFFQELKGDGPVGYQGAVLTAERSLAVDHKYIPLGAPLWLDAAQNGERALADY